MNRKQFTTKSSPCPYCGKVLDRATPTDKEQKKRAKPGDYSICIGCHNVLKFDEELFLRKLTGKEDIDLRLSDQWDEIQHIISVSKAIKRQK